MENSVPIYSSDIDPGGFTNLTITIEKKGEDIVLNFFTSGDLDLCDSIVVYPSFEESNSFLNRAADLLAEYVYLNRNSNNDDIVTVLLGAASYSLGLASRGYSERNRLFPSSLIIRTREYLRSLKHQPSRISIRSNEFAVPWDWLFDIPPNSNAYNLSREDFLFGFWGASSIISRQPITKPRNPRRDVFHQSTKRIYRKRPKVAFFYDESLSHASDEKDMLHDLKEKKLIELYDFKSQFETDEWNSLCEGANQFDLIEKFHSYIIEQNDFDIVHFACHAESANLDIEDHFRLFKDIFYQKSMLNWQPEMVALDNPIIILNACTTKSRKPQETFNFIDEFWSRGALNIICIESHISSRIALELISDFYKEFLSGNSLGLSLYNAKKTILSKNSDPREIMALFYALYGNHNVKLEGD